MKRLKMVAVAIAIAFTLTAAADVRYVKRYLAALIHFSEERKASLLVYDHYDQARGLAVLSSGKVFDIPTEVKAFAKPKSSRAVPSLSPDATKVAFAQSAAGTEAATQQEVWIFDLRNGDAKKVAQFSGVLSVSWSPAGDALAVNTGRGELRLLTLASQQSKLIATDISSNVASWSPDSHKITYESASGTGDKRDFHVNVVDVETGKVDKIAEGRYPSWSPRGDRIAYLDEPKQVLMSVPPSGGQSSLFLGGKKLEGDHILAEPVVWSPDARYVVVTGYYDGGTSLTLVDLTTSKQTVLHQGGDWLLASWR